MVGGLEHATSGVTGRGLTRRLRLRAWLSYRRLPQSLRTVSSEAAEMRIMSGFGGLGLEKIAHRRAVSDDFGFSTDSREEEVRPGRGHQQAARRCQESPVHGERGDMDVHRPLSRWHHPPLRPPRRHLHDAGGGRKGHGHHARSGVRLASALFAGWEDHRLHDRPQRDRQPLVDGCRREESALADGGEG